MFLALCVQVHNFPVDNVDDVFIETKLLISEPFHFALDGVVVELSDVRDKK